MLLCSVAAMGSGILLTDSRTTTNPTDDGFSTPDYIASGFSSTFTVSNLSVGGSGFDAFGPETISITSIDSASLDQARGLAVPSTGDVNDGLYDGPEYWQLTLTNESATEAWSVESLDLTRINDAVSGDVRLAVYYSVDGHASETLLLGPTTGNEAVDLSLADLSGYSDLQHLAVADTVSFRIYTYQGPADFWNAQANRRMGLDGLVVKTRSARIVSYTDATATDTPPAGWAFYWNAPDGWAPGQTGNLASGDIHDRTSWQALQWSGSFWSADGNNGPDNAPSGYLRILANGGAPGEAGSDYSLDRYAISSYTVPVAGDYELGNTWIQVPNTGSNGVLLKLFLNGAHQRTIQVDAGEFVRFETRFDGLSAGDEIAIAVGANGHPGKDTYDLFYEIAPATPTFDGLASYHVDNYGALGDGQTDDQPAVAAAIAAAVAAGGGVVQFDPAKTYYFNTSPAFDLQQVRNLKFIGDDGSYQSTQRAQLLMGKNVMFCDMAGAENVEMNGFYVDCKTLPYYQAQIIAADASSGTVDVQMLERYPALSGEDLGAVGHQSFGRAYDGAPEGHFYFTNVELLDGATRMYRITADPEESAKVAALEGAPDGGLILPVKSATDGLAYTFIISESATVLIEDVQFFRVQRQTFLARDCYGPVTTRNLDMLLPNSSQDAVFNDGTEAYYGWRGNYLNHDNLYGVVIEDGDYHSQVMYDDLYNTFTRFFSADNVSANTVSVTVAKGNPPFRDDYFQENHLINAWSADYLTHRGLARIESVVQTDLAGSWRYDITLDRSLVGFLTGDIISNESYSNRGNRMENCASHILVDEIGQPRDVGNKATSLRIRNTALLKDCRFPDGYFWVYPGSTGSALSEGMIPDEVVFLNCELRDGGAHYETSDVQNAIAFGMKSCVLNDASLDLVNSGNCFFTNTQWVNNTLRALLLKEGSEVWVYDDSSVNGAAMTATDVLYGSGGGTLNLTPPVSGERIPLRPKNVSATYQLNNDLALIWDVYPGDDFSSYAVYRADSGSTHYQLLADGLRSNAVSLTNGYQSGARYVVTVRTTSPHLVFSESAYSDVPVPVPGFLPPEVLAFSPVDDAQNRYVFAALEVTFNKWVQVGSGQITIKNLTDATETRIDINDASQVTVNGTLLSVRLLSDLEWGKSYAVQMDSGVVEGLQGNAFVGIDDDQTWSFTTTALPDSRVLNGDFADNASEFTVFPGRIDQVESGGANADAIQQWAFSKSGNQGSAGINGNGLSTPFGPDDQSAATYYAFLQHAGATLFQELSGGLRRNRSYRISYLAANRAGNGDAQGRVIVADQSTIYYDSGAVVWGSSAFLPVSADFATESEFDGSVWITLSNESSEGDQTVVYSDVRIVELADYEVWSALYPAADLSDSDADYDADGLTNEAERIWGLDPTSAASRQVIIAALDPGTDSFSYTRRDPAYHNLTYTVWTSTDLHTWIEDTGAQQTAGSTINDMQEVSVTVSASPVDGRLFVQVRTQ